MLISLSYWEGCGGQYVPPKVTKQPRVHSVKKRREFIFKGLTANSM